MSGRWRLEARGGIFLHGLVYWGLVAGVLGGAGYGQNAAPAAAAPAATAPAPAAAAGDGSSSILPPFIQREQTIHIQVTAYNQDTTQPRKNLTQSDFKLDIDGKPHDFTLSRPWDQTVDPKTGKPEDLPNMLIIMPYDGPQYRKDAIDEAIHDLAQMPALGWNISILDDGGDQTPYSRDMKTVLSELETMERSNPADTDLDAWRRKASLAIASMRDLPGRRVVMTLGDIYHEMVYDGLQLVYENFEAHDVAYAARSAGAVIYAAESFQEIGRLRGLFPYYYTLGFGPWMLLTRDNHLEGWISNFVSDTITEIRQDADASYDLDIHLTPKEMDGEGHAVSITVLQPKTILNAPPFYVAPNLNQLKQLIPAPPVLRRALRNPQAQSKSPLQVATQLEYFPNANRKTGVQIITSGFFWNQDAAPPSQIAVALQLVQSNTGFMAGTIVGKLNWVGPSPVWNAAIQVAPGAYDLRVAATDPTGKIVGATDYPFTVDPAGNEPVLISSLVIGKACIFAPPTAAPASGHSQSINYLHAGNCIMQPDPSHYYSPQDVLWTLARITPTGKVANRPPKDWKGSFVLVDERGSKLDEKPIHWIQDTDGSLVATSAFQLGNPKLKLSNGQYAVVLTLKGPGIERNYGEDAPFAVYGVVQPAGKDNGEGPE